MLTNQLIICDEQSKVYNNMNKVIVQYNNLQIYNI